MAKVWFVLEYSWWYTEEIGYIRVDWFAVLNFTDLI